MTANKILAILNRNPFYPLEIHLSDGAKITVDHPFEITVQPHAAEFIVYEDETERHIACRNITQIITTAPSSD